MNEIICNQFLDFEVFKILVKINIISSQFCCSSLTAKSKLFTRITLPDITNDLVDSLLKILKNIITHGIPNSLIHSFANFLIRLQPPSPPLLSQPEPVHQSDHKTPAGRSRGKNCHR